MLSTISSPCCPPRLATPRRNRPTIGYRVARVGRLLGRSFMPWQRHVVDVAGELDGDGTLWYRTVVLVVPRQQGKSTALNAVMTDRALAGVDVNVAYTAQDRSIAAERVVEQLFERQLARSRLSAFCRVRRTNGSERITFANGSRIIVTAPTDTAGHGFTLDTAVIDEAWAQTSMALPQAFGPAMVTVRGAQLWVVSTVGDGTDSLLQHFQQLGAATVDDPDSRVCYLEWSNLDDDPYDPATWATCMPALGHTLTAAAVRADPLYGTAEFERAYLCRRPRVEDAGAIDANAWAACADPHATLVDPVTLAVDVAVDRNAAAIAAAATVGPVRVVEIIDHRPGTGWVVDRLAALAARWHPRRVLLDAAGPAGALLVDLERLRLPVDPVTGREVAQACGAFVDDVVERRLRHLGQPSLDDAVAGARRWAVGDAFRWARRTSHADLSPLYAATLARHGASALPGQPVIVTR